VLESSHLFEALNTAIREVAFRSEPRDIDHFIRLVAEAGEAVFALPDATVAA
jgi:hypothetical protein